jgi:hypothetical protein
MTSATTNACGAAKSSSEAVRHYRLAELNHLRLMPGTGDGDWRRRLELEATLRTLECSWVEEQRLIVRALATAAPRDADAFVDWFEQLERVGPGQHDPLFDYAPTRSTPVSSASASVARRAAVERRGAASAGERRSIRPGPRPSPKARSCASWPAPAVSRATAASSASTSRAGPPARAGRSGSSLPYRGKRATAWCARPTDRAWTPQQPAALHKRPRAASETRPAQVVQLGIGRVLEVDQPIARRMRRPEQLVQLQMNRLRVVVLRVLNQKDHQERDDSGAGVDDELPRVGEVKERARDAPRQDDDEGDEEALRLPHRDRRVSRQLVEGFSHDRP